MSAKHEYRVTSTMLADGRQLLYFDDSEAYVAGERSRELVDSRDLPVAHTQSEIRQDPLTGEWVALAAHRMNRTFMPAAADNPLAPTTDPEHPSEIPADDYDVVVFENRFPSFALNQDEWQGPDSVLGDGIVHRRPALARCEVVCFTADVNSSFKSLSPHRARTVIEAWAHRTKALSEIDGVKAVFPFENRGEEIGVTLQHPHGQIYSYPFVPPRLAKIVDQAKQFQAEHDAELFQTVLDRELEAGERIVEQNDNWVAFVPAAAKWPLEVMLWPRRHVADFTELTDDEKADLATIYLDLLQRVDRFFPGVERTPYIAGWNQAPVGEDRHLVRMHLQLFSLMRSPGRMKFLAGSESAMGAWINDTTPERIAERMREIA